MDTDNLDFLDGETPAEPTAAAQPAEPAAPEPQAEPQKGPERGPDGKFISKQAAEPAQASAQPEPQTPAPPPEAAQPAEAPKVPEGFVPLAALQELRREFSAFKQAAQQPPQPAPDPYEDFEAYQEWQQGQIVQERADWSYQLAVARHGEDRANQVKAWAAERFAADPVFAQRAMSSRDPYGVAFEEWKRDQVFARLSDKPELIDHLLALANGQAPAAPATQPAAPAASPQTPTPPRSLAAAPNAGGGPPGAVHLDDAAVFDSTIR